MNRQDLVKSKELVDLVTSFHSRHCMYLPGRMKLTEIESFISGWMLLSSPSDCDCISRLIAAFSQTICDDFSVARLESFASVLYFVCRSEEEATAEFYRRWNSFAQDFVENFDSEGPIEADTK